MSLRELERRLRQGGRELRELSSRDADLQRDGDLRVMATSPPPAPRPLLARLLTPVGPPEARLHERDGAAVLAVPGRYSVTYLVIGPERVAAVDVGSSADVPRVLEALAWLGRPASSLAWVTPSHLHFDHAMGVDALARATGAEVRLGRVALEASQGRRRLRWPPGLPLIRMIPTWPMQGMPFLPLADWREGLDFGVPWGKNRFRARLGAPLLEGEPLAGFPGWEVLETPGHADDALALHHAGAGFLIAGDTVRNFLGGEWNPLRCDARDFARTKARLLALGRVETAFPAHGPVLEGERVLARLNDLPWWCP